MIPLTGTEIRTLIQARDLLQRKGEQHAGVNGSHARIAYEAVLAVMKHAYVETP